ncbi:hypothetical protein F4810DRAFT_705700 [Camillea tinctor]|nr:hypothetical protein F4810DRAFT_705700 [Camillea tinctor]
MSLGSLKGLVSSMNLDDPCSLKRLCSQDHQQLRKTRSLNHTISSQNRRSSLINPVKYGFSALRSSMKRNSTHADSDVIIHKYKDNAKDRHNNENGTDYKKDLDTCTQGQSPSWPASELQIKQDYPFSMDMFEKIEESGYDWTPNSSIVSSTVGSRSCSPCPSDGSTVVVDFDIEDHQYATHPKQPRWYAMLKRIKRRDTGNCELNKSLVADTNLSPYPSEKKRFMPTQDGESQAEKQPSDSPPKKVHNRDDDQDDRDDNASLRSRHKDQSKNASFEDCYFSCPYRKRNPRRFNVRDHSSCATKKLRGIHELKEHIRLVHRRHVCFSGPDSHPEDGITREVENILEKPARLAISDWNTLWRLLFPSDQYVPPKDFIAPIELEEVLLEFHECLDTMAVHVSQEIEREMVRLTQDAFSTVTMCQI